MQIDCTYGQNHCKWWYPKSLMPPKYPKQTENKQKIFDAKTFKDLASENQQIQAKIIRSANWMYWTWPSAHAVSLDL